MSRKSKSGELYFCTVSLSVTFDLQTCKYGLKWPCTVCNIVHKVVLIFALHMLWRKIMAMLERMGSEMVRQHLILLAKYAFLAAYADATLCTSTAYVKYVQHATDAR